VKEANGVGLGEVMGSLGKGRGEGNESLWKRFIRVVSDEK